VELPIIRTAISLNAFLIIGPLGLIIIVTYLHLFIHELVQISGLKQSISGFKQSDKKPFLFNLDNKLSRSLTFLIFYAVPPVVMIGFSWKSAVTRLLHILIFAVTIVVILGMAILGLQRKQMSRINIIVIGFFVLSFILVYFLLLGPGRYTRTLNLERAELGKAKLRHLDLSGANFMLANLEGADLHRAHLREADLSWADLREANLSGANLREANLSGARNLCEAILDEDVREKYCSPQAESPKSKEKP
jgi:hypothetical protein